MKLLIVLFSACFLFSCNGDDEVPVAPAVVKDSAIVFFPVTSFLQGQVYSITKEGGAPLKEVIVATKIDSTWIKMDDFKTAVQEFMTPVIDRENIVSFFKETKFKDATLGAITRTYEPRENLPDSFSLRHWDVYINPETGNVKKVYMVKNREDSILQLTWVTDKYCSIRTLIDKGKNFEVVKEEKITWRF